MLFHYHYWTPFLEETENYYVSQGFRVHQRIGKVNGEFIHINHPLTWKDFRNDSILFRIIEMRKGLVNITFGYGKSVIFDHIGFLVSDHEYTNICKNAKKLNWTVKPGDKRTFINTPFGFRIELQKSLDVIEKSSSSTINRIKISTRIEGLKKNLSCLLDNDIKFIETSLENKVMIKEVTISDIKVGGLRDPNDVLLVKI